jgi:hypothetical protein
MVERGLWLRDGSARAVPRSPPLPGKDLERDVPSELSVGGPIDLAHAAGAERGDDAVVRNTGTGVQLHRGPYRIRSGGGEERTRDWCSRYSLW